MSTINYSSPFHVGERTLQERLGVREQMERFGQQVIRSYLPDQHRDFYQKLPFILVGHADSNHWPWASILSGPPGFIQSPDEKKLIINSELMMGDPLRKSLQPGLAMGLLGIELPSRRRNRLSAHVTQSADHTIQLEVDQSFGNCPQYIQARDARPIHADQLPERVTEKIDRYDEYVKNIIASCDTFFVASFVDREIKMTEPEQDAPITRGVDVSHRGGQPGFVRVDDSRSLTIPDFSGNNHFNTLGNFELNPKAGLLFIDFENHHLIMLTGTAEVLWDDPETAFFDGAERLWRFHLDHGFILKNALLFEWDFVDASVNNSFTGTWAKTKSQMQAELPRDEWIAAEVTEIQQESHAIKSFYFKTRAFTFPSFKAGQFLTIKKNLDGEEIVRNYSLSSAPDDDFLRISVRRENHIPPSTIVSMSQFLHDEIKVGDRLEIKPAQGHFTFDTSSSRPAVLIAAGIGVTPILSMLRDAIYCSVKSRHLRKIVLFLIARTQAERAFFDEVTSLLKGFEASITVRWVLTQEPSNTLQTEITFLGRLNKQHLQSTLPLDEYDFYICGPTGFMQDTYRMLRDLSVQNNRVHAEAFGPAGLQRDKEAEGLVDKTESESADQANVLFVNHAGETIAELHWQKEDGYLLDFAEAHGLTPEFSCRSGQCGSCKVKLEQGEVVHRGSRIIDEKTSKNALLCCAMPSKKAGTSIEKNTLTIKLP